AVAVVGLLAVQARHRKRGHGLWGFQAARGNRRVYRLAGHPARIAAVLVHRGDRRQHLARGPGTRPCHADPVRPLSGGGGMGAAPVVVVVIPLLAEVGRYDWLDRVVVVDCSPEYQRLRLMRRDGVEGELADRMLSAQVDRATRLALADDVLHNHGSTAELRAEVD